jgi:hypothetical protein
MRVVLQRFSQRAGRRGSLTWDIKCSKSQALPLEKWDTEANVMNIPSVDGI